MESQVFYMFFRYINPSLQRKGTGRVDATKISY
jgi:hypothetical protein